MASATSTETILAAARKLRASMGKADDRIIHMPLSAERPMAEFFRGISRDTTQSLGVPTSLLGMPVRFSAAVPEGVAYLIPPMSRIEIEMKQEAGVRRLIPHWHNLVGAMKVMNTGLFEFLFDTPRRPWKQPITDDMTQMVDDLQNGRWWR